MISLGHINIRTDRMEATLAWYETALGFRRGTAATNPDPAQNVWLFDSAGTPSIHVNALVPRERMRPGDGGCLDHIAFNCDDDAVVTARLDAAGIAWRRMDTRLAGLFQLILTDPNGIKVELTFGHERAKA